MTKTLFKALSALGAAALLSLTGCGGDDAPAADFTLAVSPATVTTAQLASGTVAVTVTPTGGFTGAVALTVSGTPSGATATFSPASVTTGSSTLTLASGTAAAGTSTLTITGTSGTTVKTATVAWTLTAVDCFVGTPVTNDNLNNACVPDTVTKLLKTSSVPRGKAGLPALP